MHANVGLALGKYVAVHNPDASTSSDDGGAITITGHQTYVEIVQWESISIGDGGVRTSLARYNRDASAVIVKTLCEIFQFEVENVPAKFTVRVK